MTSASNIWLVDILNILLSTLIISAFLNSLSLANFNEKNLQLYGTNWSNGLLKEIYKCSNDRGKKNFINETFPATIIGCNCEFSYLKGLKNNVFPFICSDFYLNNLCSNYLGSERKNVTIWKNEELCINQYNRNYFDYLNEIDVNLKIENGEKNYVKKCKEGYKRCGILDSFDQPLCILINEKCPINDLMIDENLNKNDKTNFERVNNTNLYYSTNSTDKKVINSFRITPYGQCANPNEGNIGENNYVLNEYKGYSNCNTMINNTNKDNRLNYIDSEKLTDLYDQNSIQINKIPLYPKDYEVQNSILQSVGYYGIKVECIRNYEEKIDSKVLINMSKKIISLNDMISILSILGIIQFVISLLFVIIYKILISKFNPYFIGILFFDIVNICFLITIIVISLKVKNQLTYITKPYLYLKVNECIDEYTKYLFDIEYNKLFKIITNLNVVIGFTITYIILLFINYCLIFFFRNGPIIKVKLK